MRRRYFRFGGFGMGFPPFGFFFHGPGRFPRREDYVRMLEEYKEDLEEELKEVEKEVRGLRAEGPGGEV